MAITGIHLLNSHDIPEASVIVRRYLTPEKFSKFLESRSLYFSPASSFDDKREGHYTHKDMKTWDEQLKDWGFSAHERALAEEAKAKIARHNQKAVVISCWTSGEDEDIRMWREYGNSNEAVAIETTVGKLSSVLGPDFLIIRVAYLDYTSDSIPKNHSLQPYFYKDKEKYGWEREVRIVGEMEIGRRIETPRMVNIDLQGIVDRIIVCPAAPVGFHEQTQERINGLGLHISVVASSLTGHVA